MVTGRRILLLADDSPATQKVVSLTFADEGLEVVAVGDGAEAARLVAEGLTPDIVLADVLMPGLTGYELCERIKGDRRLAHVPVVLLVGTFEPFNEAEARRVGAETVLTKPFQSIRDLVNKVGSLIGGGKPEDETTRPAPPRHEATPHQQHGDEPRHPTPRHEATPQPDTSASFADLRMDDEMIEARTADNYARGRERAPETREIQETVDAEVAEAEAAHDSFADTLREPFAARAGDAGGQRDAGAQHEAGERRESQVYAQTQTPFAPVQVAEEARAPQTAFAARVGGGGGGGSAAADDSLFDLELEPPAPAPDADDFILDLDDEAPATPARAAASTPDAAGAFAEAAHGETVSDESAAGWRLQGGGDAETAGGGEVAAEVVAQDEPLGVVGEDGVGEQSFGEQPYSDVRDFGRHTAREVMSAVVADEMNAASHESSAVSPGEGSQASAAETTRAPRGFIEPEVVPASEPAHSAGVAEFTDGSVEGDVAKPPAGGFVTAPFEAGAAPFAEESAHTVESAPAAGASAAHGSTFPPAPSTAGYEMGAARAGVEEGLRPDQLSPEVIEAIARRVVELMSEKVVREIAWEVVPDLAELLIKQRLDEDSRGR